MLSSNGRQPKSVPVRSMVTSSTLLALLILPSPASVPTRFERTYSPLGHAHVSISNINGDIRVAAWDRRTVTVRANAAPSVSIEDRVAGDDIGVTVRRDLRLGRADFDVFVPPETSVTLRDYMGKIEVR